MPIKQPPASSGRRTRVPWWEYLGALPVAAVILAFVGLAVAISPLFLVPAILLWAVRPKSHYHTRPEKKRVAIVGGGWSGVQAAARFKELGVKVRGYDCHSDFGGTWHPALAYDDLRCHGPAWTADFAGFPFSSEQQIFDARATAGNLHKHINDFGRTTGAQELFSFGKRVTKVSCLTEGRQAMVETEDVDTGETKTDGPFDLVVFASMSATANRVTLPGQAAFRGDVYHSMDVKAAVFASIESTGKRVVVVGGSKSACDMMYRIHQRGLADRTTWVFRRPYSFFKYEYMFHGRSCWDMIRGFLMLFSWTIAFVAPNLAWTMIRALGAAWTFDGKPSNWGAFRFGILDAEERHVLCNKTTKMRGSPVRYTSDGLVLEDGTEIPCDVVIWATGYRGGMEKIAFEKDGRPFPIAQDKSLYMHFIVPDFPVLAVAAQLVTSVGPMRGCNTAELAVYHMCVQPRISETRMERRIQWTICKQDLKNIALYSPWKNLLFLEIDLVTYGILPLQSCFRHYLAFFVLGKMNPIDLKILPT